MKLVKGKVKHSLLVVYMRTILNGWVTERRMRSIIGKQSNSHDNKCVLCDSLYGEDSLEHIACCRCTKEIFAKLGIHIVDMHDFLALSVDYQDPKAMANHLMALGITYSIYNTVKHHDPSLPPIDFSELITAGISVLPIALPGSVCTVKGLTTLICMHIRLAQVASHRSASRH